MDIYSAYKSPLGYQIGNNGVDSYGVDHGRFNIRDEIEYQTARENREQELIKNYERQGFAKGNYPQYTTNFWGNSENNYGFGSSNISSAISTHPAMNTTPTLVPIDNTNGYTTESAWGYPNNTQSQYYQQMGEPYNTKTEPEYQIGTLSALEESNNGKKLWNNGDLDKTGGWSYGTYQIATKDGTMNDYLAHLQKNPNYQNYYNSLQQAGGYNAALIGDEQFKNAWANLSNDKNFLQSQQDFIVEKKLNPTMNRVSDISGWNLDSRSPVVRDVLYSTATQHGEGGAPSLLHNRFGRNTDISSYSDEDIINNIYNERSNVDRYFRSSDINTRNNMRDRFIRENAKALELLKKYP